jgi:hypothetical protein
MDKDLEQFEQYKDLYKDTVFAIDNVRDFISEEQLGDRRYIQMLPVLKKLIDDLDDVPKKKRMFSKEYKVDPNALEKLIKYANDNQQVFDRIKLCAKCKCFNCTRICKADNCDLCTPTGCYVAGCDNKTATVYHFTNASRHIHLQNVSTGSIECFNVLAVIQDIAYHQYYIVVESKDGSNDKMIFYYSHSADGDKIDAISDPEDLEFAATAFESAQ